MNVYGKRSAEAAELQDPLDLNDLNVKRIHVLDAGEQPIYDMPTTEPTSGQVLTSNGALELVWETPVVPVQLWEEKGDVLKPDYTVAAPAADLLVGIDSGSGYGNTPPVQGLHWNQSQAALRIGVLHPTQDFINTGATSFSSGYESQCTQPYGLAAGYRAEATGSNGSVALGARAKATHNNSLVFGGSVFADTSSRRTSSIMVPNIDCSGSMQIDGAVESKAAVEGRSITVNDNTDNTLFTLPTYAPAAAGQVIVSNNPSTALEWVTPPLEWKHTGTVFRPDYEGTSGVVVTDDLHFGKAGVTALYPSLGDCLTYDVSKAALRSGSAHTSLAEADVGIGSVAFQSVGAVSKASGAGAFVHGYGCVASSNYSRATGQNAEASGGIGAYCHGWNSYAKAEGGTVLNGWQNRLYAGANYSSILSGQDNSIFGNCIQSAVVGGGSDCYASYSNCFGWDSQCLSQRSTVIGYESESTAGGTGGSVAIGRKASAGHANSVVIGLSSAATSNSRRANAMMVGGGLDVTGSAVLDSTLNVVGDVTYTQGISSWHFTGNTLATACTAGVSTAISTDVGSPHVVDKDANGWSSSALESTYSGARTIFALISVSLTASSDTNTCTVNYHCEKKTGAGAWTDVVGSKASVYYGSNAAGKKSSASILTALSMPTDTKLRVMLDTDVNAQIVVSELSFRALTMPNV